MQRDRLIVKEAFAGIRSGYSADRVVADPELNSNFLAECRQNGCELTDEQINQALLNVRKASGLSDERSSHRTSFPNETDYSFASEIAIRYLERRDGVTLDQVICDPSRAAEFDGLAARICSGYTPLQYRWAALNLRKKRGLKPERFSHVCPPVQVMNVRIEELATPTIPVAQGLYLFFSEEETLYVGESTNLRKRLSKHLEHSDNKGLARWLWEHGRDRLNVEIQILPAGTKAKVRRALEAELIQSRKPVFNVSGR